MPAKKTPVTSSVDQFVGTQPVSGGDSAVSEPQEEALTPVEEPKEEKSVRTTTRKIHSAGSGRVHVQDEPEPEVETSPAPAPVSAPVSTSPRPFVRNNNNYSSGRRSSFQPRQRSYGNEGYDNAPQRDFRPRPAFNRYTPEPIESVPTENVTGYLDLQPEGHGFLRPKFVPGNRDIYISQSQIRRFMLRGGDKVEGVARPPKDNERYYGLLKVETVNGKSAEESMKRPWFDDLTPIYPQKQVVLSTGETPISTRIIDLVAPIGFGQRGMIVSPPKAGKTTILKEIAAGISKNFPEVHLSIDKA